MDRLAKINPREAHKGFQFIEVFRALFPNLDISGAFFSTITRYSYYSTISPEMAAIWLYLDVVHHSVVNGYYCLLRIATSKMRQFQGRLIVHNRLLPAIP